MRANAAIWNPQEPYIFAVPSEDHCVHVFDMRRLERPTMIHRDHVGAVLDAAWSPTGTEFCTASYDRTLRIWPHKHGSHGRSREEYHTKRMGRLFCVLYSLDARFVLSGSDDSNVRVWKSDRSAKTGAMPMKEQRAREYADALLERHQHLPEVKRVAKHRHVPKVIMKQTDAVREQKAKRRRKEKNIAAHSRSYQPQSDRGAVVASLEE